MFTSVPLYFRPKGLLSFQHCNNKLSPFFFYIIWMIALRKFDASKFYPDLKKSYIFVILSLQKGTSMYFNKYFMLKLTSSSLYRRLIFDLSISFGGISVSLNCKY